MNRYSLLKAELAKPEYDGLDDAAILSALNTPKTQNIPRGVVSGAHMYGDLVSQFVPIKAMLLPDDATVPGVELAPGVPITGAVVRRMVDDVRYMAEVVPTSEITQQMFGVAVAFGLLTPEQVEYLCTEQVSRAEALLGKGAVVTADDLLNIRNGVWE